MKMPLGIRCFGLAGLQVAIGLTALGFLAFAAEARQPSSGNRSDMSRSRDEQANDSRATRNAPPVSSPRYSPPAGQYSPPSRVTSQAATRSAVAERSAASSRQPTTILQQRDPSFEVRRSLAASDNRTSGEASRRAVQRDNPPVPRSDSSTRSVEQQSPPPSRAVQRDNPPVPRSDSSTRSVERQSPPPSRAVQRDNPPAARSDRKVDATNPSPALRKADSPNPTSVIRDRSENVGRKSDGRAGGSGSISAGPSATGRTRADDVRRRLDGRSPENDKPAIDVKKLDRRDDNLKPTISDSTKSKDIKPVLIDPKRRDDNLRPAVSDSAKSKDVKPVLIDPKRRDNNFSPGTRDFAKPKDSKPVVVDPKRSPTGRGSMPTKPIARDVTPPRFAEQVKDGKLDHLTTSETAKKVKLAEQYRMYGKGDVARRLDLEKHAPRDVAAARAANVARFKNYGDGHAYVYRPNFYHGLVSPRYHANCLSFNYWGPSFFVGLSWYPHWNPWVAWSWHHHHHAFWDPRPVWCRPIYYEPCPVWVYYNVPMWTPLPEAECGTWVDLRPPVVIEAVSDLQLLAVRFVDPGHPEEKLGPRYRVWFRNNSNQPITQPFNVMLFAANDQRLAANLPQAGVRVTAVEANDVQSVDIRLPIEALAMNRDAEGQPAGFNMLHAMVDAHQELSDANRTNNGARVMPGDILPVDPAAFELDPVAATPGAEMILAGEGLGPEPGQLLVHVNGQELQGEILGWYDLGVRWKLPAIAVAGPTEAEVIVIRGDGAATNPLKVTINP